MAANLLGDYSPESPSSAVPVYLFTITLCSPYKYIVELKTTNPKKRCLRFNFKVCFEQYDVTVAVKLETG